MGVIGARTVLDDIGVNQVRRIQVGKSAMVSQFNGSLGGIEDHRVQVRKLEMIGRRPVSNLVGR